MVQGKWSSFPKIGTDVIESVAQWKVDDLDSVPEGGPEAMQREILVELRTLIQERPDLADLVVRGVEASLRPADNYVRDMTSANVQDFWSGTARFLKASMIHFTIELLETIEQAGTPQTGD